MPTWPRLIRKAIPPVAMALLVLPLLGPAAAWAQASACERYRAELASLHRSAASSVNVQRQRGEIERLAGYYRAIGCDRGFFFVRPPAACGPIAGQIRALQASYQVLLSQATDPDTIENRRRQLRAAVARACDALAAPEAIPAAKWKGNGRLVCVRSCDGGYFPLDSPPKAKEDVAALCSALCPNAEAMVFQLPREGGIEQSVSETGEPYMKLASALRYRTAYDPSCSCKKPDEGWAQALGKAEGLIKRGKGDVLVTEAISRQMANATLRRPKARRDRAEGATVGASTARPIAVPEPDATGSIGQHRTQPCAAISAGQGDTGDRARHHPGPRAIGRLRSPSLW